MEWHWLLGMAVLMALLAGGMVGLLFKVEALGAHLADIRGERDRARKEVELLTDAIARAGKTPLMRGPPGALEPSETWYEGRPVVAKITPAVR